MYQLGEGRDYFMQEVASALGRADAHIAATREMSTPDAHYAAMQGAIRPVVEQWFGLRGAQVARPSAELTAYKQERDRLLRERRLHRRRLQAGESVDATVEGVLRTALQQATRSLRLLGRRRWKESRRLWEADLLQAWRRRDLRQVYYLSRRLAGQSHGPKKRRYDTMQSINPTTMEWKAGLELPRPQGGLAGTQYDIDEAIAEHVGDAPALRWVTAALLDSATDDLRATARCLRRAARRRSVPQHSWPAEVWHMLLQPRYVSMPHRRRGQGIGYLPEVAPDVLFACRRAVERLLVHCRRALQAPIIGNVSQGWQLDKGNNKEGVLRLRLIHGLCPLWRAYHRGLYVRYPNEVWASYEHGSLRGRRREDAMMGARIMASKLHSASMPFVVGSKDLSNAFACGSHDVMQGYIQQRLPTDDCQLLWVRRLRSFVRVQGADGELYMLSGSGGMMGDGNAPDEFLESFRTVVSEWATNTYDQRRNMVTRCAIFPAVHDGSLFKFVDDLLQFLVVPSGSAAAARDALHYNRDQLDAVLGPAGFAQNHSKEEVIVSLRKVVANRALHAMRDVGRILPSLRYLGGQMQVLQPTTNERGLRVRAANVAWRAHEGFWFSHAPLRTKRLVFLARVQSSLLTHMETYITTGQDYSLFDRCMLKKMRALLQGRSTMWEGEHPEAWPAQRVWRELRMVPTRLELQVRRLLHVQAMVRQPGSHAQIIALLFGTSRFDELQQLGEDGAVLATAHPFALRFYDDLRALRECEDGRAFMEMWSGDVRALFLDESVRSAFLAVDVRALRSAYWSVCVSGLGVREDEDASSQAASDDDEEAPRPCACTHVLADGSRCEGRYATRMALLAHVRFRHGHRHYLYQCVPASVCPWCRPVFSCRRVAQRHVHYAYIHQGCWVDRSMHTSTALSSLVPSSARFACTRQFISRTCIHTLARRAPPRRSAASCRGAWGRRPPWMSTARRGRRGTSRRSATTRPAAPARTKSS